MNTQSLYTAVAKIGDKTINIGEAEVSSVKDSGRIKSNESFTVRIKTGGTLSYTAQKDNSQPELYAKKPVQVEALQYRNYKDVIKFTNGAAHSPTESTCVIPTLEGEHIANKGDYIIKGVKGEFYPCKPDIFHKTYENEEEESNKL